MEPKASCPSLWYLVMVGKVGIGSREPEIPARLSPLTDLGQIAAPGLVS